MWDILFQVGAVVLGGLIGAGIGYALAKYIDKAKEWFSRLWREITRISRAIGILVRRGNRLFKVFVTKALNGEVEAYEDPQDEGEEIKWEDLTDEAKEALQEDDYITVAVYE